MKNYLKNQEPGERNSLKSRLVRTINRISAISVSVLALTAFIKIREDYLSTPISAQYANLNGDNRKDLIVKTRRGDTFELIQTKDGKYKLFNPEDKEAAKKEAKLKAYLENKIAFSSEDLN